MSVEVLSVTQETRLIVIDRMPQSQRELIDALLRYWTVNEVEFSITEVLRYEKPQQIFFSTIWLRDDDE